MEKFNFNGDWEFKIELQEFTKSNSNWINSLGKNTGRNAISIKIKDFKSYDPDPLEQQENTLNYIINNQPRVINALCKAIDKINDDYGERTGMRAQLPDKMTPQNLGKVLWISQIIILTEHKDDYAYSEYSCEYSEDLEHGLIIVMYGDELIEYSAVGEMGYEGLYHDLGYRAKAFIDANIKNQEFGKNKVHQVLPKYGKFKPWQELAMTEYFEHLLRTKNNEKIKEIVNQKKFDLNHPLDYHERNLTDLSASFGNIEILDYLISEGGDFSNSILKCNHKSTIEYLVNKGISIDYITVYGGTRLHGAIKSYASALKRGAKESVKLHEEWIRFYLSMGANPNFLNKEGDDYKTLLRNWYQEEVLQVFQIEEKIEALIQDNNRKNKT